MIRCPSAAPTAPNGITSMITNGWRYERSGTASSA